MARPRKHRLIACEVNATYFKPQGIPLRELEEIALDLDEIEAIRLADIEDLYHADAALKMGVSRPTFGNIIKNAHKKIAMALLEGKALRISEANESVRLVQEMQNVNDDQRAEPSREKEYMKQLSTDKDNTTSSEENRNETHQCCGKEHGHDHSYEAAHECACNGNDHGAGNQLMHDSGRGCCGGRGRKCGKGGCG